MVAAAGGLVTGLIPTAWMGSLGYTGLFLLSLVNGLAPVAGPSQIATFLAGGTLSPLGAGLAAGVGGAIGELAGYGFGYHFRSALAPAHERRIQRFSDWPFLKISRERSFLPLFVLAAIPNPLFDPVSALAGTLRIKLLQYFSPVALGKIVRHVGIAYLGANVIPVSRAVWGDGGWMAVLANADLTFVVVVLVIAIVVWGLRSFVESDPDPLVLNLTFFAFAGQCIRTAEVINAGQQPAGLLGALLPVSILLVLAQVAVTKLQLKRTALHYNKILREKGFKIDQAGYWAEGLVRITGVDYYPQFKGYVRSDRREQAVSLLQSSCPGLMPEDLIVPEVNRTLLWRAYVGICVLSWFCFLGAMIASGAPS